MPLLRQGAGNSGAPDSRFYISELGSQQLNCAHQDPATHQSAGTCEFV